MADPRVEKLADILVDHSTRIQPGDRVAIEATTAAQPLVSALYARILERGGHPHLLLDLPEQDELLFRHGKDEQLDFIPTFRKLVYDQFESRIRIASMTNTRGLSTIEPARQKRRQKALSPILEAQMRRGADQSFKWVSTLYPTEGYAMEAEMSLRDYEDFVFRACHADEADPVAFWKKMEDRQRKFVDRIEGHNQVALTGPNVDLTLSIKGRKFMNSSGRHNMPDGEIYTGPVEESANGWVRFDYPAIYNGVMVEGVELTFSNGRVTSASAQKNQAFLHEMLESDAGARYLGEFAIGANNEIDRFIHNILFDEKIGGTFHMALGAGYPETGSKNKSIIHWDMICGMRQDSEIAVDGEVVYKNGKFV
ncbi:MAG: aminopeptidase [Chloroflexi bacterium]|nr:aminopeptidase [Chloroflexota bacterium]